MIANARQTSLFFLGHGKVCPIQPNAPLPADLQKWYSRRGLSGLAGLVVYQGHTRPSPPARSR